MHPSIHAAKSPGAPAVIVAESGYTLSYGELEARSNQAAQLFRSLGIQTGDVVAILLENHPRYFELVWGAQRSGLHYVCISSRLAPPEIEYIVHDSGAKVLVTSPDVGATVQALSPLLTDVILYSLGGELPDYRSWDVEAGAMPTCAITDQRAGADMLYSSGTTGRPKGIKRTLPTIATIDAPTPHTPLATEFGFGNDTIYLSPAPLYHAAPLRWSMQVQRFGGSVVMMEKFDPEKALAAIERYRITHSQWVPTHFIRMLKLPSAVRGKYDISSSRLTMHAAAPCPVPVKRDMIEWWGPILFEYYAGTEGNGMTTISSDEWLSHPGSVGRSVLGTVRICDEAGSSLAPRKEGTIYFEGGPTFAYHNDPEKTAKATNSHGWTTLGDVGWLDEDGFLYLTDRRSFMIISGGVNIYPQEIENLLIMHPQVADAAVFGIPDDDMGESVVAVIQPRWWSDADHALRDGIKDWLRPQISGIKMPRRIDFMEELPRLPTGKLMKRLLRDSYFHNPPNA